MLIDGLLHSTPLAGNLIAGWPWTSHLTFPDLNPIICRTNLIMLFFPTSNSYCKSRIKSQTSSGDINKWILVFVRWVGFFKLPKLFVNILANEECTFLHAPRVTENNVGKIPSQTLRAMDEGQGKREVTVSYLSFSLWWRRLPLAEFSHSFLLLELLALNGVISVAFSSFSFSFWQRLFEILFLLPRWQGCIIDSLSGLLELCI